MTTYVNKDLSINYKSALFDLKSELKDVLKVRQERLNNDYKELSNAKDLRNIITQTVFYDININAEVRDSLLLKIFKQELPFERFDNYTQYEQLTAAVCNHINLKIDGLERYIENYEQDIENIIIKIEAISTAIAFMN